MNYHTSSSLWGQSHFPIVTSLSNDSSFMSTESANHRERQQDYIDIDIGIGINMKTNINEKKHDSIMKKSSDEFDFELFDQEEDEGGEDSVAGIISCDSTNNINNINTIINDQNDEIKITEYRESSLNTPKTYCYEVYFKCSNGTFISELILLPGEIVIVDADRGYDVGVIHRMLPSHFKTNHLTSSLKILSKFYDENGDVAEMLMKKISLENKALIFARNSCYELGVEKLLHVVGTEFQFDRKKLIVYYQKLQPDASLCKLIRKLYAVFKMRIWMENITVETGKEKINMLSLFQPNVIKYLELTSLPLTTADIYIFVPGLKEKWSEYENNHEIRDENTCLDVGFVVDYESDDFNSLGDTISPLSTDSSNSVNLTPPDYLMMTTGRETLLQRQQTLSPTSSFVGSIASSLLSAPYEPPSHKQVKIRTQKQKPYIPPDYLQYQPQHIARGKVPHPQTQAQNNNSGSPTPVLIQRSHSMPSGSVGPSGVGSVGFGAPGPIPIKLSHLPPESFHRIPQYSYSISSPLVVHPSIAPMPPPYSHFPNNYTPTLSHPPPQQPPQQPPPRPQMQSQLVSPNYNYHSQSNPSRVIVMSNDERNRQIYQRYGPKHLDNLNSNHLPLYSNYYPNPQTDPVHQTPPNYGRRDGYHQANPGY